MQDNAPLSDWNDLAALNGEELPLFDAALLIARDEYPDLDPAACRARVDEIVSGLREEVAGESWEPARIAAINRHLFDTLGFAGNHEDYYDPRNSYLNEVFERRLGNPISLAVVQMEVARRLGVALEGVSFPGHFLVRLPVDDGILVMDPFNRGRPLAVEELKERARPHLGGELLDDSDLLEILSPASPRAMLVRMLRNLKALYADAGDHWRVARTADRLLSIAPGEEGERRDRGLAYLRMGYLPGARSDLSQYLLGAPDAADAEAVRLALIEAGSAGARLN